MNATSVYLAPHNDDEVLWGSYVIQRDRPDLIVCLASHVQWARGTGITDHQRRCETDEAWAILARGRDWSQWTFPDSAPPWSAIADRIANLEERYEHVFAPMPEEGGHDHHNQIGALALARFGIDRFTGYLTYTTNGRSTWGTPVEPEPEWIQTKLRALACYTSQIAEPSTRPHFVGPLTEYVA